MLYLTIEYDYRLLDVIFKFIKFKQFHYILVIFVVMALFSSFIMITINLLLLPINENESKNKRFKINKSINKNFKLKSNNLQVNFVVLSIVFIILFIIFIMHSIFDAGREKAKNQSEFWIINNVDYKGGKLVKLYGENDNTMIVSPCIISTNSIIINNKYIIKKIDYDLELVKFKFDEVKLELNINDDINEYTN